MFDSWESNVTLVAAVLIAYAVSLWLGIIVWIVRDIRERSRDGWSQTASVLLVALFNIPGLFLYLILRPHETLAEAHERRLEAEALARDLPERSLSCPSCSRQMQDEFLLCPYCRTKLRQPCPGCSQALELGWNACPYCGAQGPQALTATKAAASAPSSTEVQSTPPKPSDPAAQPAGRSQPEEQPTRRPSS